MQWSANSSTELIITDNSQRFLVGNGCCGLIYFTGGTGEIRVGANSFLAEKRIVLLLTTGEFAEMRQTGTEPLTAFAVGFDENTLSELMSTGTNVLACFEQESFAGNRILPPTTANNMLIRALLERMREDKALEVPFGNTLYRNSISAMLLVLINRDYIEVNEAAKPQTRHLNVDDIFIYISKNLTEEIGLDKLANELHFSKYYILHEFKRKTGTSLHAYIVERKLSYGKGLIEQGTPIIDVYKSCGFGGYSHFFRSFKKNFGITPKQYYAAVCSEKESGVHSEQ